MAELGLGLADGHKWYQQPKTVKGANKWLQRIGVEHIKFGACKGRAVIRNALVGTPYYNRVYLEADEVTDLCLFLSDPVQMRAFGIPYRDWWADTPISCNPIMVYGRCDGKTQWLVETCKTIHIAQ